jgi:hypothetical protein
VWPAFVGLKRLEQAGVWSMPFSALWRQVSAPAAAILSTSGHRSQVWTSA